MAYTYENTPVLSKVKIGANTYYLKDAEVRALIDTFGDAVTKNVDTTVTSNSANLITSGAVSKYVNDKVVELTGGAMNFVGVKDSLPASGAQGDVVIVGTAEYVYSDGAWVLFGDEGVYLTISVADQTYVKKSLTIAGINLQDAITASELETALGLGDLAKKDSASTTLTDYTNGITGASYTPAGTISVKQGDSFAGFEPTMTFSKKYTPAGNVSVLLNSDPREVTYTGTTTAAGSVTGTTTAKGTVALSKNTSGTQITGTINKPNITVTPKTASVSGIDSVGTLPTATMPKYTLPTATMPTIATKPTAAFNTDGMKVSVSDDECLEFVAAATANAVTNVTLTSGSFNAGIWTEGSFNAGSLPTKATAQTFVTSATAALDAAPVFTGDKFGVTFTGQSADINASFAGEETSVSVTGSFNEVTVADASFSGTEETISTTATVPVWAIAEQLETTFTGTKATITPTLTKGTKTITVQ